MTALLVVLGLSTVLNAANATIASFAGDGTAGFAGDGGPALKAKLNAPFGLVRGPDGAIWFCEYEGHRIRRIDGDGIITTVGGTGRAEYSGDGGPALSASFNHPHEIRFDRAGNLFIADTSNHAIRRIDVRTRVVTTVAGTGRAGYSGDGGPGTQAEFKLPISLQLNAAGDIFVCDIGNHAIRKLDAATGRISTVAGTGKAGTTPDGAPVAGTPLNGPRSLDVDARGNLWVATREGNQVLELDLGANVIRLVAGTGARGFAGDGGPAREAAINGPKGIALSSKEDIYLADTENHAIRRIAAATGKIESIAGTGKRGPGSEGDARTSTLSQPHALWLDPDGTVFISDSLNHRIRVVRTK